MFTRPLFRNDILLLNVIFSEFSFRHFEKQFIKKYKESWMTTREMIEEKLSRLRMSDSTLQCSDKVDELWRKDDNYVIFKYKFRIVKTQCSANSSGCRCLVYLDNKKHKIVVMAIYAKTDLPKNMPETAFCNRIVKEEFADLWATVK